MTTNCILYEILPDEATLLAADDPEQFYRLRRELQGDVPTEEETYVGLLSLMRVLFMNFDLNSLFDPAEGDTHESTAVQAPLRESYELGDAWHGLHYILTGEEWSADPPMLLDFLYNGGDHWDWGAYGYRYYTPAETEAIADHLNAVPEVLFKERYQPRRMRHIHPQGWDDREDLEWLIVSFVELRAFINQCVDREAGMVITMR
ncbi:MAG: hypothetical protein CMJ46_00165 [Planctomyces sp.]|nr:hypothetical protein [Planctomyces sp.]